VLHPVVLREQDSGFLTIGGFRRLEVLREMEADTAPAVIVEGEVRDLFQQMVEEHAGQGSNLRERARAIQIGLNLGWTIEEVSRKLLPPLGLQPNSYLASEYQRLLGLPTCLLDLLVEKSFSLRRCLPFCNLEVDSATLIAEVCGHLRLGGRQIEEISTWLLEIAGRENMPLRQAIDELSLLDPLDTKRSDLSVAQALRRIEERRLPETSRRRSELDQLCQSLAGGSVEVRYDRNFATDGVEVVLKVHGVDELRQALRDLGEVRAQHQLEQLLEETALRR
jgi:ParB-like chromosome segregation protein Spo0J